MKKCTKCLVIMQVENFSVKRAASDGRSNKCKKCIAEYGAMYRKQNKDKIQKWKDDNPNYYEKYYKKNREANYIRSTKWAKENPQRAKEIDKKYKIRHKEQLFEKHLKITYNMKIEIYIKMLKSQNENCAICKKHQSNFVKKLAVDHCHKTNKIRGLLCQNCNQALGKFSDNIQILRDAIKYLS